MDLKLKLVEGWQDAWKWYSMWGATLILAVSGAMEILPSMQDSVPPAVYHYVMAGAAMFIMFGRLVNQVAASVPAKP